MRPRRPHEEYELVRVIGRGAMGTVYQARAIASGQAVAIKWMHARPLGEGDPELQRFLQEARIAGSLDSPHVVRVVALDRDPETGIPYLVMELLCGEDLRSLLASGGPLRPEVAATIAAQGCAGLAAAHAAGVVHRDLKPANLFLASRPDGSTVVKLLDFGVAKIRRGPDHTGASAGITAPAHSMTESGQMLGTPLFIAPEQVDSARLVDGRSDVYSMGVTLYAMLAGRPPRSEIRSLVQLLYSIVNEPPPPLAAVAPWVAAGLAAVVTRAMSTAPDDRYRNASEMLEALTPFVCAGPALGPEMWLRPGGDEATEAHGA